MHPKVDVSICIATYCRPLLLKKLLDSLLKLKLPDDFTVEIIVVDNDRAHTAREVCNKFKNKSKLPISYLIEPQKNIALARNRTIREAKGNWIAYIDDDEIADENWLISLCQTQKKYNADGVTGPIIPSYSEDIPKWMIRGKFFERNRYRTGENPGKELRTGNMLIKRTLTSKESFDPYFGKTGGEDSDFFRRLKDKKKVRFVWCDEAIVREFVSRERTNLRWILRRAFQGGMVNTLLYLKSKQKRSLQFYIIARSFAILFLFSLLIIPSLLFGPIGVVRILRKTMIQIGHIYAVSGFLKTFY